jgi:tetratricopeptide (TPR) repeat protein
MSNAASRDAAPTECQRISDSGHWEVVMTRQTIVLAVALIAALPSAASAQALNEVRAKFDAGQYQQAIDVAAASQDPRLMFLVGQSQQKLRHPDQAKASYEKLAARPDGDPWDAIGKSAVALLSSNAAGAAQDADQAVARGGSIAEAHFQRGLAMSAQQNFAEAAASFQKATELDPNWANAHFNAGLAFSKARRPDLTAEHFQAFLKLAPQAPERGEVQSILRTLGR